jgi:hypothetical protein
MIQTEQSVGARLPDFLIVGAQKSGTTSLLRYLSEHPEVFMAPGEVFYFDRYFDQGTGWYRRHFEGAVEGQSVGEKTAEYLYCLEAPARMAQVVPEARLIAILRNPVERAYSHYWHNRTRGHEPLEFADALAAEPERLAADPAAWRRYSYFDRGRYIEQLRRYGEHYPREAMLAVLFDDLCDSPRETFQSVCRFLEIDDGFVPGNVGEAKNRFMRFRFMSLRKPIKKLPGWLRRIAGRLNIRYESYPPMDTAVRARLHEAYAADNAALAAWLGRDLAAWNA